MLPTKAHLRKGALLRRDGVDRETRAELASRLALVGPRLVADFAAFVADPVASLFHPIGSEPDTLPLARALWGAGVRVVLPVDWSPGTALMFRRWKPGDRLSAGPLGIMEPLEDAPQLDPDILFVPIVCFDRRGNRIGYGAGNIDRTLASLRDRKRVLAVGLAFAAQEEVGVIREAHDEQLDLVVTEHDLIDCHAP